MSESRTRLVWNKGIAAECDVRIPDEFPAGEYMRQNILASASVEDGHGADLIADPSIYWAAKHAEIVWVRLAWLKSFVAQVLPRLENPVVLATGDSDSSVPLEAQSEARAILESPKIMHWFAQNYDGFPVLGRISPLPIGIDFHTISEKPYWGMPIATPREQEQMLLASARALPPRRERRPDIYVDFAWQGAYATRPLPGARVGLNRGEIAQALAGNSRAVLQRHFIAREEMWRTRGEFAFVVSPHGNGLDCHRTWEALCLGHIVIVPSSSLDPMYEGLPVVCVDRFDDITDHMLNQWLEEFQNVGADHEKLTNAYWQRTMRSKCAGPTGKVLHRFVIRGITIQAYDSVGSKSAGWIADELLGGYYGLNEIPFEPGDVAIDIGAHVGLVAIYLALRFPHIVIHSYEPFPDNYELAKENLKLNGVTNVKLYPLAVTGDGRTVEMAGEPHNSGGATAQSATLKYRKTGPIDSIMLDAILESLGERKCRLLKIDCEGSEHEVLRASNRLGQVDYLIGEAHINARLARQGHTIAGLIEHCAKQVNPQRMAFAKNRIPE